MSDLPTSSSCGVLAGRPWSPNTLQLGSAVTVSHTDRPPFRAFGFVWLAGGFAVGLHAGEPLPACYRRPSLSFVKWPKITHNLEILKASFLVAEIMARH